MAPKLVSKKSAAASSKNQPAKRRLRWAIIGTGNISGAHIDAIAQIPEIEIVAGCDIRPERLEWFKQRTGCANAKVYADYKEMLKKEKLDVVDVCTPNGVHCPATVAALEAGCHVITEKPMAMSPAECEKMIAAAKKAGKLLCAGFQVRYQPVVQICAKAREEGLLGDVMYAKIHAMRRRGIPNWGVFGRKELQGGGPLIDIGVHQIESCHFAMGEPKPVAASGMTWTFMGNKPSEVMSKWPNWDWKTYTVEDLAVGQIRFDNGAIMQIESSFCAHIPGRESQYWEIMGTKGAYSTKDATLYTDMAGAMVDSKVAYLPASEGPVDFVSKIRNFISGIMYGTPLCSPGEEGLAVQKILDGLYRSALKGGAEVKIV